MFMRMKTVGGISLLLSFALMLSSCNAMDGVIRGVSEAIISSSPSAQINRVWIDYGIKLNGNNAMKIHCDFNVLGLQRSQGDMRIWIYDENKQIHQVNGTDQYFSVGFTPAYLDTRYSDCWYAPYIEQLNFKLGQHTYYLCVTINDNNGKQLAQSQLISFTGTGRPPAQPSSPSVTPPVNNSNNETRTPNYRREQRCKTCLGSGRCSSKIASVNKHRCHGTGRCGYCTGSGVIHSWGVTTICVTCNGSTRCKYCNGSGRCSDCGGSGKR